MTHLPPLVEPAPPLSEDERARTVRQTLLPELGELGQRRLAAARVLVLGGGGLGAPVLQYLAAAGVGTLGIVDDDDVDLSNLHRQVLHSVDDIGQAKTDSARQRVLGLNPGAQVHTYPERIGPGNAAELIGGYHLVLDGTDNFETRYLVADTCAELGIPLVWASVLRFDAQVSVFWSDPPAPASAVGLRDLFPEPPAPGTVPSCAEAGVVGSLCGITGSMMATEAIKLIAGIGEVLLGRVSVVDALTMRIHELPLVPQRTATGSERARGRAEPSSAAVPRSAERVPAAPPGLDAADFRRLRQENAPEALVLLDVREPGEAGADGLPGALNVPVSALLQAARGPEATDQITALLRQAQVAEDAQLVTYCAAGVRASRASRVLGSAGLRSAVLRPEAVEELRVAGEGE